MSTLDLSGIPDDVPLIRKEGHHEKWHVLESKDPSPYVGVYRKDGMWIAQITILGRVHDLGPFGSELEAARRYGKSAVYKKRAERTDDDEDYCSIFDLTDVPTDLPPITTSESGAPSLFKGVSRNKDGKGWDADIDVISPGDYRTRKEMTLGTFKTEREAGQVYARVLYHLKQDDFQDRYIDSNAFTDDNWEKKDDVYRGLDLSKAPMNLELVPSFDSKSSRFCGVVKHGDRWEAKECMNNSSLGIFDREEQAGLIATRAIYIYENQVNGSKMEGRGPGPTNVPKNLPKIESRRQEERQAPHKERLAEASSRACLGGVESMTQTGRNHGQSVDSGGERENIQDIYGIMDFSKVPIDLPLIPSGPRSSHQYKGVRNHKGCWEARINMAGTQVSLGTFDKEKVAALVYARAAYALRRHRNKLAGTREVYGGIDVSDVPNDVYLPKATLGSKFTYEGVVPNGRGWQARAVVDEELRELGTFETEEEAAHVFARVAIVLTLNSTRIRSDRSANDSAGAKDQNKKAGNVGETRRCSRDSRSDQEDRYNFRPTRKRPSRWGFNEQMSPRKMAKVLDDEEPESEDDCIVARRAPRRVTRRPPSRFGFTKQEEPHRRGQRTSKDYGGEFCEMREPPTRLGLAKCKTAGPPKVLKGSKEEKSPLETEDESIAAHNLPRSHEDTEGKASPKNTVQGAIEENETEVKDRLSDQSLLFRIDSNGTTGEDGNEGNSTKDGSDGDSDSHHGQDHSDEERTLYPFCC